MRIPLDCILIIWCTVLHTVSANCGAAPCGAAPLPAPYYQAYQAYQQQQPTIPQQLPQPTIQQQYQFQQPAVQPTIQYYYPANTYQIAPQQQQQPQILSQIDKETTVIPGKSSYDDFEKELDKLKATPTIIKTEEEKTDGNEVKTVLEVTNTSTPSQAVTYIREYGNFAPEAYLPRPLPYRPVPYIPRGCPVIGPQFVRPIPYYPRGYVQPAILPQQPPPAYVTPPTAIVRPPPQLLPPPINDCCGKCGAPCKFRTRKNVIALASKIFTAQFVPRRDNEEEDEPKDPKCNSEQLKDIMNRFITRTVSLSKRLIQKNAESDIGGYFSVFCSTDDFSYVARSETFCQLQKNDIICYAFKHQ